MSKDRIIKYFEKFEDPDISLEGREVQIGLVLDTETTGTARDSEITEIAIVPFAFDGDTFEILKIFPSYESYNDVNVVLDERVVKLTGITNEMIAGHKIDRSILQKMFKKADVVISHHAAFDRNILENNFPELKRLDTIWMCTVKDPPYDKHYVTSAKLDYVAMILGFWFEHHRAMNDVQATLQVMNSKLPGADETIFTQMFEALEKSGGTLYAVGAPFDTKEMLKANKYRWNGDRKVWYKEVSDYEAESKWLYDNIGIEGEYQPGNIFERFRD